ncbi:unnamed protein product [Phaeothamnion confervicola]
MPRLKPVAEFLLASVVYHREFLRRSLHATHPAWGNLLFVQEGLLERLAEHVVLRHDGDTLELRVSGIPPHVSILTSLRTVLTAVTSLKVRGVCVCVHIAVAAAQSGLNALNWH